MNQRDYNLEERMLAFSANVIKHCARLKPPLLRSVIDQVIRSATSIGANYTEANNSSSKQDFRNKIYIAKKEASETRYWLQLLAKLGDSSQELKDLIAETQQFILILQKIINSLRAKPKIEN
jgi:four helix bundle protein